MSSLTAALILASALAAAVDWWSVAARRSTVEAVAKPAVMVGLIALAATVDLDPSSLRPWVVGALAAGLVGDVFLLPTVDRFVAGLGAFLVGHVCYVVAAALAWNASWWLAAGAAGAVGLVATFARPVLGGARRAGLAGPVGAYLAITLAIVLVGAGTGRGLVVAGALAFAVSDGLIGRRRFVDGAPDARMAVIVLYHLGQAMLLAGFATG